MEERRREGESSGRHQTAGTGTGREKAVGETFFTPSPRRVRLAVLPALPQTTYAIVWSAAASSKSDPAEEKRKTREEKKRRNGEKRWKETTQN